MTDMERKLERKKILVMITISLMVFALMLGSLHMTTFEGQLDFIKIKESLKVSSAKDMQKKALICQQMRRVDCAIGAWQNILDSEPNNPQPLLEMARIYREDENQQAAIDHYMKYLESPMANIDRMIEIADTLKAIGRMEEAIQMYQGSIEDENGLVNINASKALVRLYMSNGDKAKAWQAIQRFQSQTQSASDYFDLEIRRLQGSVDTL